MMPTHFVVFTDLTTVVESSSPVSSGLFGRQWEIQDPKMEVPIPYIRPIF